MLGEQGGNSRWGKKSRDEEKREDKEKIEDAKNSSWLTQKQKQEKSYIYWPNFVLVQKQIVPKVKLNYNIYR